MPVHILTSTGRIYEKLAKQEKPSNPNLSDGGWDKEGDDAVEKLVSLTQADVDKAIQETISQMSQEARYYQTFSDMEKNLIVSLQKRFNLSPETLAKIDARLKTLYTKDKESVVFEIPAKIRNEQGILIPLGFGVKDQATASYIRSQNDFYFGKFFQGDQRIRQEVLHWMDRYYLDKGNPIGKGQKGIDVFLKNFSDYLTDRSEKKARQILDTSLNHIRNAGRLRGMSEAGIELFRIDTQGDRLTCATCRSYDGRIFQVSSAISLLESMEKHGPESIKDLKPFVTKPVTGPSVEISNKYPPFHMHCRCKAVAYWQKVPDSQLPKVTVPDIYSNIPSGNKDLQQIQSSLETYVNDLTGPEIQNRIDAHMGASWFRACSHDDIDNTNEHFQKHGREMGYKTKEEYLQGVNNVLKNADVVYIQQAEFVNKQKIKKVQTTYIFEKDGERVIVSDDNLVIKSYHPINITTEKWLKNAIEYKRATVRVKPGTEKIN
jgi:ribulose bisphosphate carboxylase small subunit